MDKIEIINYNSNINLKLEKQKKNIHHKSFNFLPKNSKSLFTEEEDLEGIIENEPLKNKYENENFNVQRNQTKYNDNIWTEINILNFSNNAAVANGYSAKTKIQFVAIVYEGNYYTVAYQNTNNDSICSASYDTFLKTLSFK